MMNIIANNKLNLPHKSKSGAKINSRTFIAAMIIICVIALSRCLIPLMIQIAIAISETPIALVKRPAYSLPNILATISWCRGTTFNSLQKSPLAIQTAAVR